MSEIFVIKMAGVLCSHPNIPLAVLLLLLAGCQTTPRTGGPDESEVTTVTLPESPALGTPEPLLPAPPEPGVPTLQPPGNLSGAAQQGWPREWANVWLPLESWGKFNGLGKPTLLAAGPASLFQLQTSNGLMLVKIGSHTANIGGQEFGLGFAPRLIKGLPYVHSLDAQKTFQVLANGSFSWPTNNRTIVLDPGHGGKDSGAQSRFCPESEKHYTLDWARRLQKLLLAQGWNVVLTRSNDFEVTLPERVAIADRVGADLFLSLHFNSAASNAELCGLETYCLTPTGMPSNLLRGYEDDPLKQHPNNRFDEQNVALAAKLHRSILQGAGPADRGVRRARFMAVLQGQERPAVLIEGGYLSNAAEARRIATPDHRQALAEAVAKSLDLPP